MPSWKLFEILSVRARIVLQSAIFFVFAPLPLLAISNIGRGWHWTDLLGWMLGSGLIASAWAYAGFRGRHFWLPALANIGIPILQARLFSGSQNTGNFGVTPSGFFVIGSIVAGYVMFIIFILGEGARKAHLQTEMGLAKEIHDHLISDKHIREEQWEIVGKSSASSEVGGDLLAIDHRNGAILVTVADVSGHGVGAGVMMAMLMSALKTKILGQGDLESLFADLNNVIFELKRPDMFATAVHLNLQPDHRVGYTGAGHPPVILVRATDACCVVHESLNPPLGVVPSIPFASQELTLHKGDLLLAVSDGFVETENARGEQFGMERIQQLVRAHASRSLEEIGGALIRAIRSRTRR